jgi:protein EFR3
LTLLRDSVSSNNPTIGHYQEHLINALGQFANHHPDYQKIEIMLFIMNKVPSLSKKDQVDQLLQIVLLKSLLKVSVQYRTVLFDKAFPASFLQPLLKMTKVGHTETRITVMQILAALIDRHKNQEILKTITIRNYSGISIEPPSRSDIIFASKQLNSLLTALLRSMVQDDQVKALESAYTTAALMIVEMGSIETVQEFLLFLFEIQISASTDEDLSTRHKCNLHRIVIALYSLLCKTLGLLSEHCEQLIDKRKKEAPYLLPPLTDDDSPSLHALQLEFAEEMLLDRQAISGYLQQAGVRHERLHIENSFQSNRKQSLIDANLSSREGSLLDGSYDNDSIKSSPDVERVRKLSFNNVDMSDM